MNWWQWLLTGAGTIAGAVLLLVILYAWANIQEWR